MADLDHDTLSADRLKRGIASYCVSGRLVAESKSSRSHPRKERVIPGYRLYLLNPDSGHITGAEEVYAADDVAAVRDVQRRGHGVPVELWQGKRKITRIGTIQEDGALMGGKWGGSARIGVGIPLNVSHLPSG